MSMWAYVLLSLIALKSAYCAENSPRIIIVGAGVSGIAAATKLFEHGYTDLLILEAENRIGGRIHTKEMNGSHIDMGGQWVHGQKGNVAYELAVSLGLLENPSKADIFYTYDSSGNLIDEDINQGILTYYFNIMDELSGISEYSNYTSIGEYFENELMNYFTEHPEITETMRKQYMWLCNLLGMSTDASDSWCQVSVRDYLEYKICEGDQTIVWKSGGYKTILDVLMKKLPDPKQELPVMNHTILNAEVTKIDYSNDDGTVKVTTADGSEYVADHVIVTVSLGVLKADHETLFNPPLPEEKVACIAGLAFGSVTKTFLLFENSWWTNVDNIQNFLFAWSDSDRQRINNDTNVEWLQDQIGYITVAHAPRILQGWYVGSGARLMETLPDDVVYNEIMHSLRSYLSKDYNVSNAIQMMRSKWFTNKHFRGTYSFRSVDTEKTNASAELLSQPIEKSGKPVILFAGEATHKHHFSTVHGAIETGWREAQRIIDYVAKH